MESPFGHHHTHHHNRRNDDDDFDDGRNEERHSYPPPAHNPPAFEFDAPPPPPSSYYRKDELAPPQQVTHLHHTSHGGPGYGDFPRPPPPSQEFTHNYSSSPYPPQYVADYPSQPPPPPPAYSAGGTTVHHVSHEETTHHSHLPSFLHHHTSDTTAHRAPEFSNKPTSKVFSKAHTNFSLTIRDGKVIFAASDPADPFQHWIKDEKYSTRVKDQDGFPCFALVNKATGQAIKHSIGATHPVQLIPYNQDVLDESILWTESRDLGDGFRTIRMVNNTRLIMDAFHGDKHSGGVHDGTLVVLWEWNKGDNQRWKIIPY